METEETEETGETEEKKIPPKPRLRYPVVVEGKYDKIKLASLFAGEIFCTDGFGIFRQEEKTAFFRALAKKTPILLAVDPDGAGKVIRRYLSSILPPDRLYHVYIPKQRGKERRKTAPSKEGFLGLEGMDADVLRAAFAPYLRLEEDTAGAPVALPISTAELFALGLTGREGAAERRRRLLRRLQLPEDLTVGAMQKVLPLLLTRQELDALLSSEMPEEGQSPCAGDYAGTSFR